MVSKYFKHIALICTLFLLLSHQLHLRSLGIRFKSLGDCCSGASSFLSFFAQRTQFPFLCFWTKLLSFYWLEQQGQEDLCWSLTQRVSKNGYKLSNIQLFVTPRLAHQAPLSMGFNRQEHWSWLPFPPPEDLPDPQTSRPMSLTSLALSGGFFTTSATWEAHLYMRTWKRLV